MLDHLLHQRVEPPVVDRRIALDAIALVEHGNPVERGRHVDGVEAFDVGGDELEDGL